MAVIFILINMSQCKECKAAGTAQGLMAIDVKAKVDQYLLISALLMSMCSVYININ